MAKIGHWELDAPTGTPLWSVEVYRIFGLDPQKDAPSFAEHRQIIHAADWPSLEQAIEALNEDGTPFNIHFRIQRANGELGWMHAKGKAEKDSTGAVKRMFGTAQDVTEFRKIEEALSKSELLFKTIVDCLPVMIKDGTQIGIGIDITERKKLEQSLQQAQKMEAIGKLAGGIAHDFNNILAVIFGNISYISDSLDLDEDLTEALQDVQGAVKHGQSLTRQLITFAWGGAPIKKVLNLNLLVKENARLVMRGSASSCRFHLAEDLWTVEADGGQLSQAVSNILINALFAA